MQLQSPGHTSAPHLWFLLPLCYCARPPPHPTHASFLSLSAPFTFLSHSLPSLMTSTPIPCLPLLRLPILIHSNPLPSYLLFTQALRSTSFPLCSKPVSGQRVFGDALDCPLFPATAQAESLRSKWKVLETRFISAFDFLFSMGSFCVDSDIQLLNVF